MTQRTYELLTGETITYETAPDLDDFIARLRVDAHDPTCTIADFVDVVYGEDNPLLERGIIEGRGVVTKDVYENPAYRVMLDLIDHKRVTAGELDPESAADSYSMSVSEAAERLGVTPGAVRQAVAADKIDARKDGGQWRLRASSVEAYAEESVRRGPVQRDRLEVVMGSMKGCSLTVRSDGEFVKLGKDAGVVRGYVSGWTHGALKLANKQAGAVEFHRFRAAPDASTTTTIDSDCGLHVRGYLEVVDVESDGDAAHRKFGAFRLLADILEGDDAEILKNGEPLPVTVDGVELGSDGEDGIWVRCPRSPNHPFQFGEISLRVGDSTCLLRTVETRALDCGLRVLLVPAE